MPDCLFIDLAVITNNLIGKNGGVRFYTQMVDHNIRLAGTIPDREYRRLDRQQRIIIGTNGIPITTNDIQEFLTTLRDQVALDVFDNGRTYNFEGIEEITPRKYMILWGS